MTDHTERRADKRINHKAEFLKIKAASESPELANKELLGSTVNISASGLQIVLDNAVPLKSSIDVWVTLRGDTRQYFLTGEVRWCNEAKPNEHHIGILVKDRKDVENDYKSWRESFK